MRPIASSAAPYPRRCAAVCAGDSAARPRREARFQPSVGGDAASLRGRLNRPQTSARYSRKEGTGMATDAVRRGRAGTGSRVIGRLTTETKHSLKTTEFWAMVAIIVGILLASMVVGQGDGNGNGNVDAFPAVRAWLYIAIVGVGYMVSRGLAKAGSREPYWADEDDLPGGGKN